MDTSCPIAMEDGDACSFTGSCWHQDTFSSCHAAGSCTCVGGKVECTPLAAGDACGDAPFTQCSVEGNPSCDTAPTSEACSCNPEGVWVCGCYCYGGSTTCSIDPCDVYPQRLQGARCSDEGHVCTYPGNTTCTCEASPDGSAQYACR